MYVKEDCGTFRYDRNVYLPTLKDGKPVPARISVVGDFYCCVLCGGLYRLAVDADLGISHFSGLRRLTGAPGQDGNKQRSCWVSRVRVAHLKVGTAAHLEIGANTAPLQGANGLRRRTDDPALTTLAIALLECVGLPGRQRRVFVCYRRIESRNAAIQLHDLLSSRGFDVFLDTHDIRPGEPFQKILWHRLCDSDVMVMLDTPTYFASKWTRQELGRARAKEIHVLRVGWADFLPTPHTDFAETICLN